MASLKIMIFVALNMVTFVLCIDEISRLDFPASPDFVFGAGSSAYQYEGATFEEGRTPSIWDTFARDGYMRGATGDVAADGYHKYKEDVQLMVNTGLEAYRFSIAWPRLIPDGRGPVNPKGLEYYNNVINELVKHGIEPHVTLLHIDVPQALEDEYGGWLSHKIVEDFTAYADVCFREFGDRVSHWTTFNEANLFVTGGYYSKITPPRRCSPEFGCLEGNSSTEPYIAAHNMLLAHSASARLYKQKYQEKQNGLVGINLCAYGITPYTSAIEDVNAAQRAIDFTIGWFLNPLVYGDYPNAMKRRVGSRLPKFTEFESKNVEGSFDFLGLNYYFPVAVKNYIDGSKDPIFNVFNFFLDGEYELVSENSESSEYEYPVVASCLLETLEYIKKNYENPPIYIHENGQRTARSADLNDKSRVSYTRNYISKFLDALRNGVNGRGYFHWSFIDLVELFGGFDTSFGLYYVDREDKDLKRYPKSSAHWYTNFLKGNNVTQEGEICNLADSYLHDDQ